MGYGVYSNDFGGRGSTFNVSGSPEDNQAAYDDHNEALIEAIEAAAIGAGFEIETRRAFRGPDAPYDSEFSALASNGVVAVGWRSWVTDFVVAVGPTGRLSERLDLDAETLLCEHGRGVESQDARYADLVAMADEYFRLCLLRDGLECRYRVTSYTSSAYALPENADARIAELGDEIKRCSAQFDLSREDALSSLDDKERAEVIRAGRESRGISYGGGKVRYQNLVVIPFVDKHSRSIRGFAPQMLDDMPESCGLAFEMAIPDDILDFVLALPGDDAAGIPRTAETAAFFARRQSRQNDRYVYASASEFAAATGEEVVVDLPDLDGKPNRKAVLSEVAEPATAHGL